MRPFWSWALLLAGASVVCACSSSSSNSGGSAGTPTDDAGAASPDAAAAQDAASVDGGTSVDSGLIDAATGDGATVDAAVVDAGALPLDGYWSGTPADCTTMAPKSTSVTWTMTFKETTVNFSQSFSNGFQTCSTEGEGTVSQLTDSSFEMDGYTTGSHTCSLAIFINKPVVPIEYTFLDTGKTAVFIKPQGEECSRMVKQ